MMRNGWKCLLPLLLAGCAHTPAPQYYALTLPGDKTAQTVVRQGPLLQVHAIDLPAYLSQPGIAYQEDDIRLSLANEARWADALDSQLTNLLVGQLGQSLPGVQVLGPTEGGEAQGWILDVGLQAFQGRYDGQALIAGRWVLRGPAQQRYSGSFSHREPLQSDGYPALVRSLRKGWLQQVEQLATQLQPALAEH